jgi:predicted DsbA family dithiol-disulfide isomerase
MRIEIWSDVVCPWCYIGKRRLEAALARFPHADDVQVVWRSFELDPTAPAVREVSNVERLAHKYGVSVEQAQTMLDRMTSVAAGEDLHFRLDIARSGNTFDAHRLLHLAAERGVQDDLKEALLAAYQTEGEAISNHEVLTKRAVEVGLEETEVRDVLAGDRYGVEVRRDEAEGEALGLSGVPFFVIDGRYAVSGAQDRDVLVKVLERAWSERSPLEVIAGDACGIDGCE